MNIQSCYMKFIRNICNVLNVQNSCEIVLTVMGNVLNVESWSGETVPVFEALNDT